MKMRSRLAYMIFTTVLMLTPIGAHAGGGEAKGNATATATAKVAIKADVQAAGKAKAAAGDALYAKGELEAALVVYGEGFAATRDAAFIYAMAQCHHGLDHAADARAMFEMYLAASASASLKYEAEARARVEGAVDGAAGAATKVTGAVKDAAKKAVYTVKAGVYTAIEVSIATQVKATARAEAKAADAAYAAKNYGDAAKGYLAAYAKSQQTIALYAAAQAHAQAGNAIEARALLLGYLASKPKGATASDAKTLLLAIGGQARATVKVAVKAKVSAKAKATTGKADKAFKAGQYVTAAKLYAEAHAKASDAALLYAQAIAQYYAGMTADAAANLQAYLASGGTLEFEASAKATLRATGAAG
jgi:hypothetical protein